MDTMDMLFDSRALRETLADGSCRLVCDREPGGGWVIHLRAHGRHSLVCLKRFRSYTLARRAVEVLESGTGV